MEEHRIPDPGDPIREQHETDPYAEAGASEQASAPETSTPETAAQAATDDEIQLYPESHDVAPESDPYESAASVAVEAPPEPETTSGGGGTPPPGGSGGEGGGGDEGGGDDEMVKMSFLEHLEELRKRIIRSLIAVAAAFFLCFAFSQKIFETLSEPVRGVLRELKMQDTLYFTKPTDSFTIYLNLALVAGLFISSPVVLYQVWAFISPGLYKREKKYAIPFVFFCSSLFIAGGAFAYFIAFPYALKFLLTFGGQHLTPLITATEFMDMFWTVILGLGLVFELPVLMMFLGLIGIVTPGFLIRNFRYAILLIFIVAAVVTPTSDIMNMMIFAVPMIALFILGVGLVWLVQRKRKSRWVWKRE